MARALGLIGILILTGCGVDGPPVPPGQDNPDTVSSVDELNPSGYF